MFSRSSCLQRTSPHTLFSRRHFIKQIYIIKMPKLTKLRSSLEDKEGLKVGTVLILLAGRFRGKRVVLVGREQNTLVVSGPYKVCRCPPPLHFNFNFLPPPSPTHPHPQVNGVPLRRVDPAYVIATSTQVCTSLSYRSYTPQHARTAD